MTKLKDIKYKLGRGLAIAGLIALPFAACEKDDDIIDQKPNTPATPRAKTYTFVYDEMGIPQDTLLAHMDVDTLYVIPTRYDLFATWSEEDCHMLRNHLQGCRNTNSKTRGKGRMRARDASVADSTWLAQFGYKMER